MKTFDRTAQSVTSVADFHVVSGSLIKLNEVVETSNYFHLSRREFLGESVLSLFLRACASVTRREQNVLKRALGALEQIVA